MENFNSTSTSKKENRKLILQAITLLAIIIIIIIVSVVINLSSNNSSSSPNSDNDMAHGDINTSDDASATLNNTYIVYQAFGNTATSTILESIRETALSASEITSTPNATDSNAYTITIDDNSLSRTTYDGYMVYTFTFAVSDGRTYQAYLRRDSEFASYYYGLVIHRIIPTNDTTSLSIHFIIDNTIEHVITNDDGTSGNTETIYVYNRSHVIDELTDWAKSLNLGTIMLNVTGFTD